MQNALSESASRSGFSVVPFEEVEKILRRNGFTDGGQFQSTTPQKLGKMVGADFLVMGNVEQFRLIPIQEVKVDLNLVYAPEGKTVFSKTFHVISPAEKSNVGGAIAVIDAAAAMLFKKARGTVLKEECEGIAERFTRAWPDLKAR